MFGFVTAALASASVAAQGPPAEPLVAINPRITLRTCEGVPAIALASGGTERQYTDSFVGLQESEVAFAAGCTGFFETEPHFCIAVAPPGGYLALEVIDAQGVDATMALVGDRLGWTHCDDDSGTRGHELLPKIEVWVGPGEYTVYVGSYSRGVSATFDLAARLHDGSVW